MLRSYLIAISILNVNAYASDDGQDAFKTAMNALNNLQPCERELVQRLVLDQGPMLGKQHFHQMDKVLNELGLHFDRIESEDVTLSVSPNLSHHKVMSIRKLYRGDFVTDIVTTETRVGVPHVLAERVDTRKFWHKDSQGGYQGVLSPGTQQTRGAAELQRYWLDSAGVGSIVDAEIAKLESEGIQRQHRLASEALVFYMQQVDQRRDWSPEMKSRLRDEFYDYLDYSTLSIVRLHSDPKSIVGTLQMIRTPHGRRTVLGAGDEVLADDFGMFGDSVRRFGIKHVNVYHYSDAQLFDIAKGELDERGELNLLRPPVEVKLREQGWTIARAGKPDRLQKARYDDQDVTVWWGDGEVDEPTRFAIDRNFNPKLFVEILTSLFISAIDPHFSLEYNRSNRALFTYSDKPQMYSWANFKPTGVTIEIDGRPWSVVSAMGGDHIDALMSFTRSLEANDEKALQELKANILDFMHHRSPLH